MPDIKVTIETTMSRIRIKFNDVLHLSLVMSKDLQVQSWYYPQLKCYCIEYYSRGITILCEYEEKGTWEAILKGLEEAKLI